MHTRSSQRKSAPIHPRSSRREPAQIPSRSSERKLAHPPQPRSSERKLALLWFDPARVLWTAATRPAKSPLWKQRRRKR